jgi:hypothetical protein
MKPSGILLAAALCLLPMLASAAPVPALPDKPAGFWGDDGANCRSYGYLEGPSRCDWLQGLGEPTWPVTDAETRLAVRMIWILGDLNPDITLRLEIQDTDRATLRIYEGSGPQYLSLEGSARLTTAEIGQLLIAEQRADIWSKPYNLPSLDKSHKTGCEIETVFLCYDYLTLAEVRDGKNKVVEGDCPEPKANAAVLAFAHLMIRVAQHHFPDFAKTPLWREELNSN